VYRTKINGEFITSAVYSTVRVSTPVFNDIRITLFEAILNLPNVKILARFISLANTQNLGCLEIFNSFKDKRTSGTCTQLK
jgi:hypothetical protein